MSKYRKHRYSSSRVLGSAKKFVSNFWDKYDYDDYSADSNSDYWLKGSLFDRKKSYFDEGDNTEKYDYFALAQYKRAITNFVHILTGNPDIKVNYTERGDSYTDGKEITLSASMKEKDFDSNVGLALHEASHILYSDFDKLKSSIRSLEQYNNHILTDKQRKILERTVVGGGIRSTMKTIINIVEDLYIDAMTYANAPGYRGYYQSLYHKFFGDDKIIDGFYSKEYSEPTMDNYLFHLCNIRNPNRNLKALPELDVIWSKLDLSNIRRLTDAQDRIDLAWDILDVVTRHCVPKPQDEDGDGNVGDGDGELGEFGGGGDNTIDGDEPQEDDTNVSHEPLNKTTLEKLKKLFDKQIELINGDTKKTKLTNQAKNNVDAISSVDVDTHHSAKDYPNSYNGYRGVKTLVIRNVNDKFIDSQLASTFGIRPYPNYSIQKEIERFISLGKVLAKNLKIRNEERSLTTTRQKSGALDKRLLHEIGHKNYEVFKRINLNQYRESYIHISIDTSGSMGSELADCVKFATMFAVAAKLIKNIHVVVSVRTTTYGSRLMQESGGGRRNSSNDGTPFIMYIFDSKKDNIAKIRKLFPRLSTLGTTPEGLTFEAAMRDIKKSSANTDAFFINLCDGQPYFSTSNMSYSGDYAKQHSKRQTDRMMQSGINVLTYYIGSVYGYNDLKKTYPINCFHLNNASEVTKIVRVLNGNLLKRADAV